MPRRYDAELPNFTRTLLFDFDYTLADSSEAVVECFNAGLAGIGLPAAGAEEIKRTIGLSLPDSLARVAGEEHRPHAEEFRRCWRALSDEIMVDLTRVFEPVPGMAKALRAEGRRLGVVSTKWRCRIEEVFARDDLSAMFDVIVGGDDVERHKPDPEGIHAALRSMRSTVEEALYIGDSVTDAEAARRAGVRFVAVLSGMTPSGELAAFEPLAILEHVGELPALVESLT